MTDVLSNTSVFSKTEECRERGEGDFTCRNSESDWLHQSKRKVLCLCMAGEMK